MNEERVLKRQRTESPQEPLEECFFFCEWEGSDAVLVVEERKLHVHSIVLSLHSPVFKAMFTSGLAESKTKEISLPGKEYKTVENLLKMMYPCFSLNLWETSLQDMDNIMSLVQEYIMDSVQKTIQEHCGYFIERKLKDAFEFPDKELNDKEDAVKIMKIADRFGFHDVVCKTAQYLSRKYNRYSAMCTTAGGQFSDKVMIKVMENMIKRNAKKVKEVSEICRSCSSEVCSDLTHIERLSERIISESCLKDV